MGFGRALGLSGPLLHGLPPGAESPQFWILPDGPCHGCVEREEPRIGVIAEDEERGGQPQSGYPENHRAGHDYTSLRLSSFMISAILTFGSQRECVSAASARQCSMCLCRIRWPTR